MSDELRKRNVRDPEQGSLYCGPLTCEGKCFERGQLSVIKSHPGEHPFVTVEDEGRVSNEEASRRRKTMNARTSLTLFAFFSLFFTPNNATSSHRKNNGQRNSNSNSKRNPPRPGDSQQGDCRQPQGIPQTPNVSCCPSFLLTHVHHFRTGYKHQ